MESEPIEVDRDAVIAVMREHSASKPNALLQAQQDSMAELYERQLEAGNNDELTLDTECGMLFLAKGDDMHLLFAQIAADELARSSFAFYRQLLPASLRIHQLPLNHVGALATPNLSAFAGWSPFDADDFIAVSVGMLRLTTWGIAYSRSCGAEPLSGPKDEIDSYPVSWWQASLAALAAELHGWSHDRRRSHLVSAWAERADFGNGRQNIRIALEGFVFFHEIAHFEFHNAENRRLLASGGQLTSQDFYQMEYEADRFALEQLQRIFDHPGFIAESIALLFAFLALEPSITPLYPDCVDGDTHPHPLTRLMWLAQALYPEDRKSQMRTIRTAIGIVMRAMSEYGIPFTSTNMRISDFEAIIEMRVLCKPSHTDCTPGGNEVLHNATKRRRLVTRAYADEAREPRQPG